MRTVTVQIKQAQQLSDEELYVMAKEISAPYGLLKETAMLGRLPVVNFAAGGIATPADAALMMQLGCDGVFVGSGIFKSGNALQRAKAIVQVKLLEVTQVQVLKVRELIWCILRLSLTTTTQRFLLTSQLTLESPWLG